MTNSIGVAVIGAGMAGRSHAHAYRTAQTVFDTDAPPVSLVAIADDGIVDRSRVLGHRLVAVAARDRSRADAFAAQRGVEKVYQTYAEVIDDPEVEVVYNALVNSLHARWNQYAEVRDALTDTRHQDGPVVVVVPAIPHAELPAAGVWWDVAPAEVSEQEAVAELRADYAAGLSSQRWFG